MHLIDLTPVDFWQRPREVAEFINVPDLSKMVGGLLQQQQDIG